MNVLTPEILADIRTPSDVQISPDGRRIVFAVGSSSRREEHDVSTLWIADADGSTSAHSITSGFTNDTAPRWSQDGRYIAFLSDRKDRGKQQVQVLTMHEAGGEAQQVTDARGGVRDVQWLTGDTRRIAYLAIDARSEEEEERRKDDRDDANVHGAFWARSRLFIQELDHEDVAQVEFGSQHVYSITPAPDGERIAAILWETPELDGWMKPSILAIVNSRSATIVRTIALPFHPGSVVWRRDGDGLFVVGQGGETAVSSNQLWAIDLQTGEAPRLLTPDADFCIANIVRGGELEDLVVSTMAGTESSLHTFSPATRTFRHLQHVAGDISSISVASYDETIAYLASTAERPDDVFVYSATRGVQRVSDLHTMLDDITLGRQDIVRWQRASLELDGILIYPPGATDADGPFPTIVSIHGGPYGRWPNEFITRFGRWIAQHGYLVFLPNARGGAGHGQAFAESVLHTVGNEDYLDIMAGVDMLIERGLADGDRLGCGGWSQGGFMTAWIVGHTDRFKAGVMGAGVSDWGMMIATSDIPTYENLMGGGDPYAGVGPHSFDAQSPISYVHNAKTPVLILHGENDERVPLNQATFFHRGLRRYGVPTELVTYPREGHGIRERTHQIDLARRIVEWYQQWIPTGLTQGK